MENPDFLQMRTTNINIRISPLLKSTLIEKGAALGLTLSDFILHLLTKGISYRDKELEAAKNSIKSLESQLAEKELELHKIESMFDPLQSLIGKTTSVNGVESRIDDWFDILTLMVQHYKLRK